MLPEVEMPNQPLQLIRPATPVSGVCSTQVGRAAAAVSLYISLDNPQIFELASVVCS